MVSEIFAWKPYEFCDKNTGIVLGRKKKLSWNSKTFGCFHLKLSYLLYLITSDDAIEREKPNKLLNIFSWYLISNTRKLK